MKNLRTTFLLFSFVATVCIAQCNPHPLHPNMLPPCPTIADKLSQAHGAAVDFQNKVGEMKKEVGDARTRYWKLFPNGPGIDAAEAAYMNELNQKDMYYLMFALPDGMTGRTAMMANAIQVTADPLGVDPNTPRDLKKFPNNVDGGIRPFAFPLFAGWVTALRRAEGREKDDMMATPTIIATAIQDKSNFRKAYEQARDWAEFESSGLDISKYVTPQAYILNQMESDVSWILERSEPADIPDPGTATRGLYNQFVKTFGEKEVIAAASAVLHTPKNSMGGLAKRADVTVGTYLGMPSPDPFMLFLTELTNSSARTYAVALCMDRNNLLSGEATATFNKKEHWENALSMYEKVVAKYGEANVLAAAARIKDAPKDSNGIRGDTEAKGTIIWFQALLKEPKTELPEAGLFKASSYDPHWMDKEVEVRGTVSRVDLDKGKFPPYATIHFKESNGDRLTVYTPNSDMWQDSWGESFAGLIGKPIDVFGQVTEWREGSGVRVLTSDQLKVIDAAGLASTHESHPKWLTAPIPTQVVVDALEYLGWKKYPPGSKANFENRLLMEYKPGTNQFTRNKISHYTFQLDSIDNDRAVVSIDTTTWHMSGGQTQSTDKLTYKAKKPPTPPSDDRVVTTGEETLTINGKQFACKWEKAASAKDPEEAYTKTWRSGEVPGGLVLMQFHSRSMATGPRSITETIYAPIDGVTPEQDSKAVAESPASPTSQPVQANRAINNAGAAKGSSSGNATPAMQPVGRRRGAASAPPPVDYTSTNASTPTPQAPDASSNANTAQAVDYTNSNSTPTATQTTADQPASQPNTNAPVTQPTGRTTTAGRSQLPFRVPGIPPVFGGSNRLPAVQPQSQTDQMAMIERYNAAIIRIGPARNGLAQLQRAGNGSPVPLPDEVRAAGDRLLPQQRAVTIAMRSRDNASTNQSLQKLEDSLKVIEDFLSGKPRL